MPFLLLLAGCLALDLFPRRRKLAFVSRTALFEFVACLCEVVTISGVAARRNARRKQKEKTHRLGGQLDFRGENTVEFTRLASPEREAFFETR